LNPIEYDNNIDRIFRQQIELKPISINNSLIYNQGLMGNNIIFGASNINNEFRPQQGSLRNVDGIIVITEENRFGKLNSNARVRKGPSINYENYNFILGDIEENLPYFPIGRTIEIIGRSETQETIQNLTGYWYYCNLYYYGYNESGTSSGWIFGPLIDIE